MWQLLLAFPQMDGAAREYILDLSHTISRYTLGILGGLLLGAAFLLGALDPARYLTPVMVTSLPLLLTLYLVRRAGQTSVVLANVIMQLGLMGVILLGVYFTRVPELALLLILLPLLAALTLGWRFALAVDLLVILEVGVLGAFPAFFPLPPGERWAIMALATLTGLLSAAAVALLLDVLHRSYRDSANAQRQMEETRQQRMDLIRSQEDLVHANRELARLSERLKGLNQVAEDAKRVKEEFVANVSHELRTPLNMIIGFSELIAKAPHIYGGLPPALLADIAAIQRNSQHLADLVNDVLDLSQVEAGRMSLVKEWTTLQELVETAVSATKVLFDTKGLYLRSELPAESVPLFCDRTRIREVLLNLLSNAGRFTDEGGVLVRAVLEEGNLVVSVSDSGPGIAPDRQGNLFEPFQPLDNSIRRQGGTGLGLSISKRFVELHNGKMWLSSEVGKGTTFLFSLPVMLPVPAAPGPSGSRRWVTPYHQFDLNFHRSQAPTPVVLPRYVLMDRGDGLQRLFSRYTQDVEVITTSTKEGALEALCQSPCQALIINGATVSVRAEEIQAFDNLPFITPVMTCWMTGNDAVARELGVMNYLLKPVSRERLLGALENLPRQVQTILLVDDDLEVLQLFARILNSAERGYSVLRARDGMQALQILRERRPDVMLIDLVMPEMDGFQVLKAKEKDAGIREIPVIIISSKDPVGTPILSDHLAINRKGGLSAQELIRCIHAVSDLLAPEASARERRESSPA